MARIIAAADIGSNTAHLLVARTDGTNLTRLINRNDWIALGETVARQGKVPVGHVSRIVSTLKTFKTVATKALAESIYVFATDAMRSASNHAEVMRTVKDKTGLNVKLITAELEAYYGLRGVLLDVPTKRPALLLEVGGGSAQVAAFVDGRMVWEVSLPIGTGRLIAGADMRNPCPSENVSKAVELVKASLSACPTFEGAEAVVAGGGVGRGLWRAAHPDGERRIVREEVEYLIWATARLTPTQIAARFGVGIRRAETLLPGAIVHRALLDHLGFKEMAISEYGVREGAILEIAEGKIKAQAL